MSGFTSTPEVASAPEKSGISETASPVAVHTPTPWRFCERGNMGSAIEAQTGRRQYIGDDGYRIIATYQGGCTSELYYVQEANRIANGELIVRAVNSHDALVKALETAIRVADEAREEWDKAPSGMKAGKLLIALSDPKLKYRADITAMHEALATAKATEVHDDR